MPRRTRAGPRCGAVTTHSSVLAGTEKIVIWAEHERGETLEKQASKEAS